MAPEHKLLTDLYLAFNARDIDRCLGRRLGGRGKCQQGKDEALHRDFFL